MTPELLKRLETEIRAALPLVGGFGSIDLKLNIRDGNIDRLSTTIEKSTLLREVSYGKH